MAVMSRISCRNVSCSYRLGVSRFLKIGVIVGGFVSFWVVITDEPNICLFFTVVQEGFPRVLAIFVSSPSEKGIQTEMFEMLFRFLP